jgi:hypothetical protein
MRCGPGTAATTARCAPSTRQPSTAPRRCAASCRLAGPAP